MSKMKLTVDTLDNKAKSAVINVGANSGYVEGYLTSISLALFVYDKEGNVVSEQWIPIKKLKGQA